MLTLFKKQSNSKGSTLTLEIEGMHCPSCSMNIDGSLEDLEGVLESKTSYPKSKTIITFNPKKVSKSSIIKIIQDCGYDAKES